MDIAPFDLSPQFLAANDIVGFRRDEGVLVVTARRPLSDGARAALEFAAGGPVTAVTAELEPPRVRSDPVISAPGDPSTADKSLITSLGTSLFARANRQDGRLGSLVGFADCLEAGYSPRQAAELMLFIGAGRSTDADLRGFCQDISASGDFAVAVARCRAVPFWLGQTVAATPDPVTQVEVFARLVPIGAAIQTQSGQQRFRSVWFAAVWILAASAWALLSILAGGAVAAAGLAFALWRRGGDTAPRHHPEIMRVVHAAHQSNLPPAVCIRTAGQLLMQFQMMQGRMPETRESLGAAFHLSPLRQAIFARGDLGEAAERLARLADRDREQGEGRAQRIVCCAGVSAFVPLLLIAAQQ